MIKRLLGHIMVLKKLEKHYKDMQDVEFTVENKKLWMLQTRSGKRTAKSAVKIAVDMVKEKLISKKEVEKGDEITGTFSNEEKEINPSIIAHYAQSFQL